MPESLESECWLHQPLAIIGMACRLPGGDGLEQFWQSLVDGRSSVKPFPDSRLDRRLYFDAAKGVRGRTYSDLGGFVSDRELDWNLLGIDPSEANSWDPCHLNLCEVAARAVLNSGYARGQLQELKAGVFVGHSGGSTLGGDLAYRTLAADYVADLQEMLTANGLPGTEIGRHLLDRLQQDRPERKDGRPRVDASYASALISRTLGLDGASLSIDAACASSLVALALASNSLHSGESDVALVGGASFNKADSLILFSHAQSCSADGTRPFDEQANGLIGSEGYVVLLVKTLTQAEADGDKIDAVIRGIGISSDGRGRSLWAPRKEGQYEAIRRAYSSKVRPDSVQLIEAHATSTQVGDATEMEALAAFYEQNAGAECKIPVGSVKSNIGHTLETAGLAGLVKTVLAIQHKTIPPSIGVEQLSSSIPWEKIPLYVPDTPESWEKNTVAPRRAAVNAFGIGGLNVHVVVDEYIAAPKPESTVQPPKISNDESRIAVVGRGVVLPNARNLQALLQANSLQVRHDSVARIRDFEYDWRKHKVPPKQIAHANPLQFMLLDAAEQAFNDAQFSVQAIDSKRTAVVVGSPFGGDFGNSLFAGLRLPEFEEHLRHILSRTELGEKECDRIIAEFQSEFLRKHPALLDETGSFTSSTLASRLSKTFDLMGGALAIDAGDCSGAAAICTGMQLLQSGVVDLVLCAAAHSALDAAAIENLTQQGRFPVQSEHPVVGEGVAMLLLQRESTARRNDQKIFSVLHSAGLSFASRSSQLAAHNALSDSVAITGSAPKITTGAIGVPEIDLQLNEAIGSLGCVAGTPRDLAETGFMQAVQPLIDVIQHSRGRGKTHSKAEITQSDATQSNDHLLLSHTSSGLSYALQVSDAASDRSHTLAPQHVPQAEQAAEAASLFRFEAKSLEALKGQLGSDAVQRQAVRKFSSTTGVRCVVQSTPAQLQQKCETVVKHLAAQMPSDQFVNRGIFWSTPKHRENTDRVAWLFPGQGSQYHGMLRDLVTEDQAVAADLAEADRLLFAKCNQSFGDIAWNKESLLGDDFWQTQSAILVGNWLFANCLRRAGLAPDVSLGHSFGEFSALLDAGCWSLEEALEAVWQRCVALDKFAPSGLMMLGVQESAETVESILGTKSDQVYISHQNAPKQTVVGGRRSAVVEFSQHLEECGIASRLLAVPTAFHTPFLESVKKPFCGLLQPVPCFPPRSPVLSGVNGRYVGEPDEIKELLARQLTQPIDFVSLLGRLKRERIHTFVEVGPQQVLAKLIKQTFPDSLVLSCDSSKLGAKIQMEFLFAQMECLGLTSELPLQEAAHATVSPTHFDATQRRKTRLRKSSSARHEVNVTAANAGSSSHFDATKDRRERNAGQSTPGIVNEPAKAEIVGESTNTKSPVRREQLIRIVVDYVVEQTGYPPEIIELDWDIEADLGIDSIKKAQLFGELRELFDFESLTDFSLDKFKTLNQIVDLLEQVPSKRADNESPRQSQTDLAEHSRRTQENGQNQSKDDGSQSVPPVQGANEFADGRADEFTRVLIDFVVEQTGYPREIVELDAELEADLGIDSIKQAQLLGEMRELFGASLQPPSQPKGTKAGQGFATLRSILNYLLEHHISSDTPTDSPELVLEEGQGSQSQNESRLKEASAFTSASTESPALAKLSVDALQARANYARFVSRPNAAGQYSSVAATGQRLADTDVVDLSGQLGVQPAVIHQFEVATLSSCGWGMVDLQRGTGRGKEHPAQNGNSGVRWLAEYRGPDWLAQNRENDLLCMHETSHENKVLRIAGSRLVEACIVDRRFLLLAGTDCKEPYVRLAIRERLAEISSKPSWQWSSLIAEASSIDSENYFLLIVDPRDATAARVGKVDGSAYQEKVSLAAVLTPPARQLSPGNARIGFDRARNCIVLESSNDYGTTQKVLTNEFTQYDPALVEREENEAMLGDLSRQHGTIASRYVLRMAPSPLKTSNSRQYDWQGGAVVVGDNPVARQLVARLRLSGVQVDRISSAGEERSLQVQFQNLSSDRMVPYLFLTTPWDEDARASLDPAKWQSRREKGILENYWLCQSWLEHVTKHGVAHDAQLVAVSSMGGDFGFGGRLHSAEGGGLAGLLKSMLIETWTQGVRPLPIKIIDCDINDSPSQVVDNLWQELRSPSYDFEVAYKNQMRHVVRAIPRPLAAAKSEGRQPSGTFVCTGGARGITAYVAEQLALRYDLNLQLIGKSPEPKVDPAWKTLDEVGLRSLKTQVMTRARDEGKNPVTTWQDTEKAIEIDATLRRFQELGIEANYYQCDVSDFNEVEATLERIRQKAGPIKGVLHGAGVGRDARFDRKQPEKVQQCISAKVDGSLALMRATRNDPLEYFIGFGSISGRFGANGHTDYSLANEMLCKQIDWFGSQRPEVKAVGFHWHAWGDVGMATKPETRLALEMINMQFMPAAEGIEHLVQELESESDEREVLITDDRYYRMFFPSEALVAEAGQGSGSNEYQASLLDSECTGTANADVAYAVNVNPVRDPFLAEHRLGDRPLLPFVVAAEILLEAGRLNGNENLQLREFRALSGLRFFSDDSKQLRVELAKTDSGYDASLLSDFVTREGKLVEANRKHFEGMLCSAQTPDMPTKLDFGMSAVWHRPVYPPEGSEFYVGWPLQRLRKYSILDDGLIAKISAPALIELAGMDRDLAGWLTPSAAFDACLFATGILAWQRVAPGSALPASLGLLTAYRMPAPGEALEVHVQLNSATAGRASFDFSLYGVDGSLILSAQDYEVAWLNAVPSIDHGARSQAAEKRFS